MIRVKYTSTAQRFPGEVVDGSKTIEEFLAEKNAHMQAQFNINGRLLSGGELRMTFDEAIERGYAREDAEMLIFETAKTTGA